MARTLCYIYWIVVSRTLTARCDQFCIGNGWRTRVKTKVYCSTDNRIYPSFKKLYWLINYIYISTKSLEPFGCKRANGILFDVWNFSSVYQFRFPDWMSEHAHPHQVDQDKVQKQKPWYRDLFVLRFYQLERSLRLKNSQHLVNVLWDRNQQFTLRRNCTTPITNNTFYDQPTIDLYDSKGGLYSKCIVYGLLRITLYGQLVKCLIGRGV